MTLFYGAYSVLWRHHPVIKKAEDNKKKLQKALNLALSVKWKPSLTDLLCGYWRNPEWSWSELSWTENFLCIVFTIDLNKSDIVKKVILLKQWHFFSTWEHITSSRKGDQGTSEPKYSEDC